MTSEQIWAHDVTCHPEDVQDRSSYNQDLRVYVPDTIRKLGVGENDYVLLEKRKENGVTFIVGEKLTEDDEETSDSEFAYELFKEGSSRLRVTLGTKWIDDFIEYDADDILVVEVNAIDDEFRIYKNDDYDERKAELSERGISPLIGQPVIMVTAMGSQADDSESSKSIREGFGDDIDDAGPSTTTK